MNKKKGRAVVSLVFLMALLCTFNLDAFKIDRVILATDKHENYIHFWPLVSKAWQDLVGVKPTLALIGDSDVQVDESLGDVVRFKPIEGIPTWFYAQNIRLLLPAYFPDDVCIVSDMDMLPLSRSYFVDSVKNISENKFVVYRDKAYQNRFPMCYVAARGSVFKEIFDVTSLSDIPNMIEEWFEYGLGWNTDEMVLYHSVLNWSDYKTRCVKLGYYDRNRICRNNWNYNLGKLKSDNYHYAHMLKPYSKYKKEIDKLAKEVGIL